MPEFSADLEQRQRRAAILLIQPSLARAVGAQNGSPFAYERKIERKVEESVTVT